MSGEPIRIEGLKQGAFSLLRTILLRASIPFTEHQFEALEFAARVVRDLADDPTEAEHAGALLQAIITAKKDSGDDQLRLTIVHDLIMESFEEVDNRYDSVFEEVVEVRKVSGFPSTDYGDQPG